MLTMTGRGSMKKKLGIAAIILIGMTTAYADDAINTQQGAADYDWQSCLDSKSNECLNSCQTSEDIHCSDNCNNMAKDKCLSEGFSQPQ